MKEKGREERGPKAHSKNSDFGPPLIYVLFSGLPTYTYTRKFACQRALRGSFRGLCGVSPRVLRGLRGALRVSAGFSEVFGGSDPMLATLGHCWIHLHLHS